jgi:hypothetical protein
MRQIATMQVMMSGLSIGKISMPTKIRNYWSLNKILVLILSLLLFEDFSEKTIKNNF